MDKDQIIGEIRRVAGLLNVTGLSLAEFKRHGRVGEHAVRNSFGSWNEAIAAAGLTPTPSGPQVHPKRRDDDEYLLEIVRLWKELGHVPSGAQMSAKGRFSEWPYQRRWGSFGKACELALASYVTREEPQGKADPAEHPTPTALGSASVVVPTTVKPLVSLGQKKVQFGEPIDFRGLRFAPVNEDGVIFLFGMVSRELGFLIESVRTEYPDCEGKRCVDKKGERWEHVRIEFEYKSSNFVEHGHDPEGCDLIVCWIHDWLESSVEVLELRSQLRFLSKT